MKRVVRWLTLGLLGIYLLIAAGVPLPLATKLTSLIVRYPCENSTCGCKSADGCWRSCCCHTLEEKLAWAAEHQVQVPAYVKQSQPRAGGCCSSVVATESGCCERRSVASGQSPRETPVRVVTAADCSGNPWALPATVPGVRQTDHRQGLAVIEQAIFSEADALASAEFLPPPTPPPDFAS